MSSSLVIRKARPEDCVGVLELIRELAAYEKAADEVELTEERLCEDAFGDRPAVEIIVADRSGKITGAALFYEKYSTWKGRGLHLEDLVVREADRGKGIGSQLFEAVAKYAADRGYSRMDWQVLDWNESAIGFYNKYKAEISREWLNGRLTSADLQQFRDDDQGI